MCRNTQRGQYPRIQTFSCAFWWLGWQSSQLAQVAQLQGMGYAYKMAWSWYVMPCHAADCEYVAFICIHCIIAIIPLSYNLEDSFSSIWIYAPWQIPQNLCRPASCIACHCMDDHICNTMEALQEAQQSFQFLYCRWKRGQQATSNKQQSIASLRSLFCRIAFHWVSPPNTTFLAADEPKTRRQQLGARKARWAAATSAASGRCITAVKATRQAEASQAVRNALLPTASSAHLKKVVRFRVVWKRLKKSRNKTKNKWTSNIDAICASCSFWTGIFDPCFSLNQLRALWPWC